MTTTADAIVIGVGVMGLCCAQQLNGQGVERVALLERRFIGAPRARR